MKRLNEIYDCPYVTEISGIKTNSKEVVKNDLFICVKGVTTDRHEFIREAVLNGAKAIVVSKDIKEDFGVPLIRVKDTNLELEKLSRRFYDDPPSKLSLIGVTGTDGKTTVSTLIKNLLGSSCAYIGTNGVIYKDQQEATANTTPGIDKIYEYMDRFIKSGCDTVSMEVSSEAYYRHRIDNLKFDIGVLTNITGDHLNIHGTFDNYLECKKKLFENIKKDGCAILNMDDRYFPDILDVCHARVQTYGFNPASTLVIRKYRLFIDKTEITFTYNNKEYQITTNLLGKFNIYNLMATILVLINKGKTIEEIRPYLNNIEQVAGRVEKLDFGQDFKIILDYAHTVNGVKSILEFVREVKDPASSIITCLGSAGGREKTKRSLMGSMALDLSNHVIFTMDDPRDEDVNDIIDDLVKATDKTNYERILDRSLAIYKALSMALKNDIVLVLGKGRDDYMAIGQEKVKYSDYNTIKSYFLKKK